MKTNEVLENIKARRSVRAYTGQQVLEEDLQAILEAATYAPSGMHLETWHFTAIQNMDKLTELNERIKGAFAKSDDSRLQERGHSKTYCCYYHAPTLVIVSNEPTQWWAGMDCACAIENMFLAAQSLGIGSCWINQLGTTCDDPEFDEFINKLKITVMNEDQKKLVDRMLRTYDVTSNQCVKIVKEISYTPDQVEMMKKLYPYVRDKRNFNKVIDILFSNAYKDEMRKFIEEYHQNNK